MRPCPARRGILRPSTCLPESPPPPSGKSGFCDGIDEPECVGVLPSCGPGTNEPECPCVAAVSPDGCDAETPDLPDALPLTPDASDTDANDGATDAMVLSGIVANPDAGDATVFHCIVAHPGDGG